MTQKICWGGIPSRCLVWARFLVVGCLFSTTVNAQSSEDDVLASEYSGSFDSVTDLPANEIADMIDQTSYAPWTDANATEGGVAIHSVSDSSIQLMNLERRLAQQESQLARLQNGPARPGKLFARYESVIVQPVQSNQTALIVQTGDEEFATVMFPWEMKHSPRVTLGYEPPSNSVGWQIRYWQFNHGQSFVANEDNGIIQPGWRADVPYLVEDGDVALGVQLFEEGTFTSRVRADVIDLEVSRNLIQPVDAFIGMRYGKFSQAYSAVTDEGSVNAITEFRGLGPTMALRLRQTLPLDRLTMFGTLRGAMLYGQKDFLGRESNFGNTQHVNGIDLRSYDEGVNSFAGSLEMQVGIEYTITDHFTTFVAFEGQHHSSVGGVNPPATMEGRDGDVTGDSVLDDDLSFVGLTTGIQLQY
ncbi:hypothetical protein [Rhodopirellula sp. P2]|uniref:hypothetical protein n=1 Tax=Rhodopirellula sp. P2 TaxID=2127060 RepID=UPI00236848AC|nr:hypothetical protein [Rhodopirellula sp. P2]WDQ17123.1 hypothetical protein PSR62_00895 [Rhodopirellula sp. P2]